jgi:hypothetical protein
METRNPLFRMEKRTTDRNFYYHLYRGLVPLFLSLLIISFMLIPNLSYSVPSYSRQTGMPCSACHRVFPQLTTFGREFKLNGYTFIGSTTIEATNDKEHNMLKILASTPLSAMFQTSLTYIDKNLPESQNMNVEFPQQLSLFYSGLITPHLGTFIQVTYTGQDGSIGLDNTDIRYSNTVTLGEKRLIYGFTLNNNPTVQDVWNSIPAWRFPYATSGVAPTPAASPVMEGALAQQVAGLGAYGYFNSMIYLEGSIYRSAPQGMPAPPGPASTGIIKGVAPYWRLALQHQWNKHYLEIGTTGLTANMYPAGVTGPTNQFTDIGVDAQYEFNFAKGSFVIHPSYYWEKQSLVASFDSGVSQNRVNYLNSFKISGELFLIPGIGFSLGYFAVNGSNDALLYPPSPVTGSRLGSPLNNGFIAEVDYLPWYNIRLSLQYIYYNNFNGTVSDYDGSGRSSRNNNTLYLLAWFNF